MSRTSGEETTVVFQVKLKMNTEDHNHFSDHENDEQVNRGGELNSEKDDEKHTTKEKSKHNDRPNSENKLFCLTHSLGGLFEQHIRGLEEKSSKKKGNSNDDGLVDDGEGSAIIFKPTCCIHTTRAIACLLSFLRNHFRINNRYNHKQHPNREETRPNQTRKIKEHAKWRKRKGLFRV